MPSGAGEAGSGAESPEPTEDLAGRKHRQLAFWAAMVPPGSDKGLGAAGLRVREAGLRPRLRGLQPMLGFVYSVINAPPLNTCTGGTTVVPFHRRGNQRLGAVQITCLSLSIGRIRNPHGVQETLPFS